MARRRAADLPTHHPAPLRESDQVSSIEPHVKGRLPLRAGPRISCTLSCAIPLRGNLVTSWAFSKLWSAGRSLAFDALVIRKLATCAYLPHRLEANSPEVCNRRGSAASKTRVGREAARVFVRIYLHYADRCLPPDSPSFHQYSAAMKCLKLEMRLAPQLRSSPPKAIR